MQHADYFKKFLVDHVNIDDTRLKTLKERVEAVYRAIREDEDIGNLVVGMSRQGSWAHELLIRPRPGGEFDADFLIQIEHQAHWEPARYIDEVCHALDDHPTYKAQKHGRKCRCVWLKYAANNDVGCHLDIVPFITLPDGRRVIVNRDDNIWEPQFGSTDPQGFTNWVKRRSELTGNEFRRVVRLMKFLKREKGSFNGVRSVVLTTVLGQQVNEFDAAAPEKFRNIPTALLTIVERLDGWLQTNYLKPSLPNPSGDGTNFDHRWNQETYSNFRDRIHSIASDMRAAMDETDAEKSVAAWQKLFGDEFKPPIAKASSSSLNPFSGAGAATIVGISRSGRSG